MSLEGVAEENALKINILDLPRKGKKTHSAQGTLKQEYIEKET